jgi:hypothetical protein
MPGTALAVPLRSAGRTFVVPGRAAEGALSRLTAAADAACHRPTTFKLTGPITEINSG